MGIFDENESILDVELGRILRIPCKFIEGEVTAHPTLIKSIIEQIRKMGKNLLPLIVQVLEEDRYKAIQNIQILQAARQANLDFVWCIVIDEKMLTQILIESGELIKVPILTASEQDIAEVLEYIQIQDRASFRTINPKKAAKAIVEQRTKTEIKSLYFLTKQKCGIGRATIPKIKDFLVLE